MTSLFNIIAMAYMHAYIVHVVCVWRHAAKVAVRYSPQKIKIHFTIWRLGKNNFYRLGTCCRSPPHAAGADNPKELTQLLPVRGAQMSVTCPRKNQNKNSTKKI
jgi:hypothetical protein